MFTYIHYCIKLLENSQPTSKQTEYFSFHIINSPLGVGPNDARILMVGAGELFWNFLSLFAVCTSRSECTFPLFFHQIPGDSEPTEFQYANNW